MTAAASSPPNASTPSAWTLVKPYLFDVVGPFAAYLIVHSFGAAGLWAMTAAGAAAGLSAAINTLRRRKVDALGMLVILEILASIAVMLWVRDARLMLIRPSVYTAVAAVYLGLSAFVGRPATYAGSRVMAARGGAARIAAYERAWDHSPGFRRTHRAMTLAFGVCLAVDTLLRVIVVYHAPLDRAAWLSNVPHLTAMMLMVIASAIAGRTFSRYVDDEMKQSGRT